MRRLVRRDLEDLAAQLAAAVERVAAGAGFSNLDVPLQTKVADLKSILREASLVK